jgi:hypothetical protein
VAVHRRPDGGWDAERPDDPVLAVRLLLVLGFIDGLGGRLCEESWTAGLCLRDGWRESTASADSAVPGARVTLCFGLRRGQDGGMLLPEAHYLQSRGYRRARLRAATLRQPYRRRAPRAVYAGGDHGNRQDLVGPGPDRHVRARLARVVTDQNLPVDVWLGPGPGPGPREQARYRAVLDLDGHVRTWDAWFWKMTSGSVVLSQQSSWTTFFSESFRAWEHFVPLQADLADLPEQLEWVASHPMECAAMAAAARAQAREAYAWQRVRARTQRALESALLGP